MFSSLVVLGYKDFGLNVRLSVGKSRTKACLG